MGDWGVGMPASLYLHEFGSQVWAAFGEPPYLVGSVLRTTKWRDVDVRLILDDETYEAMGFGAPDGSSQMQNGKWVSLCMAYSALGKHMTGLPIDFQIQQQSTANELFKGPRSALCVTPLRIRKGNNDETSIPARRNTRRARKSGKRAEVPKAHGRHK